MSEIFPLHFFRQPTTSGDTKPAYGISAYNTHDLTFAFMKVTGGWGIAPRSGNFSPTANELRTYDQSGIGGERFETLRESAQALDAVLNGW